jgi:tRNA G18 (ribose-2'-O)-methylase SpoU
VFELLLGPVAPEDEQALLALAARRRVRVARISEAALREAAETPDPGGVVARALPLRPARLEDLCVPVAGRRPVVMAVPGPTTEDQLGQLLREGERRWATGAVVGHRGSAAAVTPRVACLAAGAVERLGITLVRDLDPAAARLRAAGGFLLGIDRDGASPEVAAELLERTSVERPVAVVLAGPGRLGRQTLNRCHAVADVATRGLEDPLLAQWIGCAAILERSGAPWGAPLG